jgi:hypothetical protein
MAKLSIVKLRRREKKEKEKCLMHRVINKRCWLQSKISMLPVFSTKCDIKRVQVHNRLYKQEV